MPDLASVLWRLRPPRFYGLSVLVCWVLRTARQYFLSVHEMSWISKFLFLEYNLIYPVYVLGHTVVHCLPASRPLSELFFPSDHLLASFVLRWLLASCRTRKENQDTFNTLYISVCLKFGDSWHRALVIVLCVSFPRHRRGEAVDSISTLHGTVTA